MTPYALSIRSRPASFADRGAAVPFQAPALMATSARADERAGIAAVMPNFAGTGAHYIIPWPDLPAAFVLNTADHALHHAIAQDRAVTPDLVEAAMRRVAETGAAGPLAQQEARRARGLDLVREVRLHTILLVHLARMNAGQADGAGDIRAALRQLRHAFPMRAGENLLDRTALLARELLPVGLPESGELRLAGRLRVLLADIANMRRHLARRVDDMPELRELALRFERCSTDTLQVARRTMDAIDLWLLDLPAQVGAWPDSFRALRHDVRRLTWLLDGWEQAIGCYANCVAEWFTPARERHLGRLASLAPDLPAHEVAPDGVEPGGSAALLAERMLEARRAALSLLMRES